METRTQKQYTYAYDANDVCVSEALNLQMEMPFPHPPLSDIVTVTETVTETVAGTGPGADSPVPEPERVVVTVHKLSGDAVQLDLAPLARECLYADGAQITSYLSLPEGEEGEGLHDHDHVRRTKKDFSSRLRTALARAVLGADASAAEVAEAAPRVMLVADGEEVPEVLDGRAAGDGS